MRTTAVRRRARALPGRAWRAGRLTVTGCVLYSAGPSPQQLYGRFTWKIDNFSEISKRELRSNVFEVGSYKWCVHSGASLPP